LGSVLIWFFEQGKIHVLKHSLAESGYITMGRAFGGKLLVVVHTDRGDNIRIIGGRPASRRERKFYEESIE
jgi:uncharacterized DUF497 family protein